MSCEYRQNIPLYYTKYLFCIVQGQLISDNQKPDKLFIKANLRQAHNDAANSRFNLLKRLIIT